MRHCKWLRRSTINYEIPDSSKEIDHLTPLVQIGFLQDSKIIERFSKRDENVFVVSALDDLDAGLRLLTVDEMREFSKRFHCQSKSNQSKKISIENLKNLTSQYKSMFASSTTNRNHLLFKE